MIERYQTPEMNKIVSDESILESWFSIEFELVRQLHLQGLLTKSEWEQFESKARSLGPTGGATVERVRELESTLRHDVIAFITALEEKFGSDSRWIHFGLTSSDVVDTGWALRLKRARHLLIVALDELTEVLWNRARETRDWITVGRTHGMTAEPTVFGLKFLSFFEEAKRNRERLEHAFNGLEHAKLSGAVGNNLAISQNCELQILARLGLKCEPRATQVIPRDRYAELASSLAILGGFLERMALEVRHLQRSEIAEAEEGFQRGQKGSSAMPHKRNPIAAENLTGVARMLRGYSSAALENIALWHERDISHSSVERVFLADSLQLSHYALRRARLLMADWALHRDVIEDRGLAEFDRAISGQVLLLLVRKGALRQKAYEWVQKAAFMSNDENTPFIDELMAVPEVAALATRDELVKISSPDGIRKHCAQFFQEDGPVCDLDHHDQ